MVAQIDKSMMRIRPAKAWGRLTSWALVEGRPLTTRGQWINPLVFSLYRMSQRLPLHRGSGEPIFILGTGRSGTTILGKLLAMHKDAVFLNEPKAAWNFVHDEEDLAGSYSTDAARVRIGAGEASPQIARQLQHIYSLALRLSLSRRVVDKYPELIYRLPFVTALFPRSKSVAITRDGVDTCASVTLWSQREGEDAGAERHDWWGRDDRKWRLLVEQLVPEDPDLAGLGDKLAATSRHEDRAAVEWILSTRETERARASYKDHLLAIKYEDMCRDPDAVLGAMLSHCGLSRDETFLEYARTVLTTGGKKPVIALDPEILPIFRDTLRSSGYGDSVERTSAHH